MQEQLLCLRVFQKQQLARLASQATHPPERMLPLLAPTKCRLPKSLTAQQLHQ
jgi:hypothetical protein